MKKQQESEKRKQLLEKLNKSFSHEKVLLDKSVELAKAHISKESIMSIKLLADAKSLLKKDLNTSFNLSQNGKRSMLRTAPLPLPFNSSVLDASRSTKNSKKGSGSLVMNKN